MMRARQSVFFDGSAKADRMEILIIFCKIPMLQKMQMQAITPTTYIAVAAYIRRSLFIELDGIFGASAKKKYRISNRSKNVTMKTTSLLTTSLAFIFLLSACPTADGFAYIDPSNGSIPGGSKKTDKAGNEQQRCSAVLPPGCDPQLLQEHAQFAYELADAARLEILPYWRQSRHTLGQEIKVEEDRSVFQSASPVTLADRAAERAMRELITERYPQHGVYGEEYGVVREDADWVWGEYIRHSPFVHFYISSLLWRQV